MSHVQFLLSLLLMFFLSANFTFADARQTFAQDDTVKAKECLTPPIIDGKADETCWAEATWQAIDQVWITWGQKMETADFSGRYKATWSSTTDRIYFLVEIVDDVLVDGYKYPQDGYYNWDVVEIFFDEDASGGDHTLNQNAFAYHVTAGNNEVGFEAMDLGANYAMMNYSDHLDCAINRGDNLYVWEISMIVYNENYNPSKTNNPIEPLQVGKVSGLSIAYCDNDDPNENPKTRDNFIGSVAVPKANYNDHWQNADWFGKLKLVAGDNPSSLNDRTEAPSDFILHQNFPNPFNPRTTIAYELPTCAYIQLIIYDALGLKVRTLVDGPLAAGAFLAQWNGLDDAGDFVASGVYFYQLNVANDSHEFVKTHKMILMR